MDEFAIEMQDVVKIFPGHTRNSEPFVAVDHVSLHIRDGEFFSLLGPSGCGKTTSLRMIAGFEQPTSGQIVISGKPMAGTPAFQRPVNTVFQHYALFPHMSVSQNVGFGLEMNKVPKAEIQRRVDEALELVRLPHMGDRTPKQLSGGQQQRIALARALINRPKVLLLDEPLGALDLKLRKEMQLELKQLQMQVGITFIYVTHDQEEALTMSDRIAVMDRGKALQVGSPLDIYEEPNSRFVADFIGETNFVNGRVLAMNGVHAEFEADGLKMVAAVEAGVSNGAQATLAVRPEKLRMTQTQPDDTPNAYLAEVYEVVYVGTDTRYRVRLSPTVSLNIRQQNVLPVGMPAMQGPSGMRVWVSWQPDSARVLAN